MSTSTPTSHKSRLSRLKHKKQKTSPLVRVPDNVVLKTSVGENVSLDCNEEGQEEGGKGFEQEQEFRNYDQYTSSPFHMPNSQAPVPGRDVFWDLDTPQSRKHREQLIKKIEATSTPDSEKRIRALARVGVANPRLHIVAGRGVKESRSQEMVEQDRRGEEAMLELLQLCQAQELEDNSDGGVTTDNNFEEDVSNSLKQENISMLSDDMFAGEMVEEFVTKTSPINVSDNVGEISFSDDFEENSNTSGNKNNVQISANDGFENEFDDTDPFDDCNPNNAAVAFNNDSIFGDEDDSFLVHATQAAEQQVVTEKGGPWKGLEQFKAIKKEGELKTDSGVGKGLRTVTDYEFKVEQNGMEDTLLLAPQPAVINRAISRLKVEEKSDGFGSDDSFDDFLSQLDEDPVTEVKVDANSVKQETDIVEDMFEQEVAFTVEEFDDIKQPIVVSQAASPVLKRRRKSVALGKAHTSPTPTVPLTERILNTNTSKTTSASSLVKKHASFDTGLNSQQAKAKLKKEQFQRVKSSPNIEPHTELPYVKNEVKTEPAKSPAAVITEPAKSRVSIKNEPSKSSVDTSSTSTRPATRSVSSKEDMKQLIERKRREAVARRAASQTIKPRL